MTAKARTASSPSTGETGSPAPRSAATKPACRSRSGMRGMDELLAGPLLVGDVLEDDAERGRHRLLVEVVEAERDEGTGPVDGLGDGRRLFDLQGAHRR